MTRSRIVLHPVPPQPEHLDRTALVARLRETGLIDAGLGTQRFRAGPRFLELIVFLGCSPYVRLGPEARGDANPRTFTYVQIPSAVAAPQLLWGQNTRPPRCPGCRREIPDWRLRLLPREGTTPAPQWRCPGCGKMSRLQELNWRHGACLSGFPVSIWQVHEGEAVPSDGLLQMLEAQTGGRWDYCYLREPAQG